MNNHRELLHLVQSGVHPQVTFKPAVEELESYPEPGMKAIILAAVEQEHDLLKVTFDYAPFESHNQAYESANYFNKDGVACLTAREYGAYKPQDWVYLSLEPEVESAVSIDESPRVALFARYQQERTSAQQTYVSWLEDQVLAST